MCLLEELGRQTHEVRGPAALRRLPALALEEHLERHLARLLDDVVLLGAGRDLVL